MKQKTKSKLTVKKPSASTSIKSKRAEGTSAARNTLGGFLKKSRAAKGLSQTDVATALGYTSPQFVSDWEREVSSPPMKKMFELSRLLGVKTETLFDLLVQLSTQQLVAGLKDEFIQVKKTLR